MVQRLGVTLTLSDNSDIINIDLHLIPALEEAFQEEKINKIVLKGNTKCEHILKRIAATVETLD